MLAHRDTEGDIDSLSLSATPIDEDLVSEPADDAAALGALVEHVSELLAVIERNGRIRFASPGISHLLQRRAGGLVGLDFLGLIHPDDAVRDVSGLARVDREGNGAPIRIRLRASDQSWRHLDAVVTDLRSKQRDRRLRAQRPRCHRAGRVLRSVGRRSVHRSRYGPAQPLPAAGSAHDPCYVIHVARGLRPCCWSTWMASGTSTTTGSRSATPSWSRWRNDWSTARGPVRSWPRLRSDEFAVVLPDVVDTSVGRRVADALRVALAKPFEREDVLVRVTASIGVALGRSGEDPDELLRRADLACIEGKQANGGNTTVLWGAEMARRESRRRDVELQLRHALDHAGIQPHYQPIVDLATGKVVGAEALLRVRNTDGALLTPGEFVGAAESAGLLSQLGAQVLSATCEQLVIWGGQMRADAPRHLAVNISPRQLNDASLPAQVMAAVGEAGIEPESLWLELTEGMLLAHQEVDQDRVRFLRELGVRVGLDEFGAGYSNLAYVRRFPLDFVKIDRSLIAGLGEDERDTAVVRATIELARDLGLTVVAVGVENDRQLDVLLELGASSRRATCSRRRSIRTSSPRWGGVPSWRSLGSRLADPAGRASRLPCGQCLARAACTFATFGEGWASRKGAWAMLDGVRPRKRHKKKRHFGARLFPTQIDDLATEELFTAASDDVSRRPSDDFVIDLPRIEKSPTPLPRRAHLSPAARHESLTAVIGAETDSICHPQRRFRVWESASYGCRALASVGETGDAVAEQLRAQHQQHDHHDDRVVIDHELLERREHTGGPLPGEQEEQHRVPRH